MGDNETVSDVNGVVHRKFTAVLYTAAEVGRIVLRDRADH
jgi:hypothetical protein